MDDKSLMLAILQAVAAAATSATDEGFKAMCADLQTQLAERAKAMGIDAAGADPPPPASERTEQQQAAKRAAAGQPGATQVAGAGLQLADVRALMREERAKEMLIASAKDRPGMTPAFAAYLAEQSLDAVRTIVATLPAPAGGTSQGVPATPLVAGAGAGGAGEQLTAEEAADIKALDKIFGADPEKLTASREAAKRGEAGVLSVARLEKIRLAPKAKS